MGTVFGDVACPFSTRSAGGFLPSRHFARMAVRERADGRETKTVSGGTAWQTERWAPQATDIDVLSSGGNLAQRTGPYLE